MQISQEPTSAQYHIRSYSTTQIQINDQVYQHSVIISPTQLITSWPPQSVAELTTEHLQELMNLLPEIILIGTGTESQILPANLHYFANIKNISLETMNTSAACRTYNLLVNERRKVVAGLMLATS